MKVHPKTIAICGLFFWDAVFTLKIYTPKTLKKIPHQGFTQGLVYHQGYLYESTGLYSRSTLKKIDAHTGEIVYKKNTPIIFSEGLALASNKFYQISWKKGILNIYDKNLRLIANKNYLGEGWGLTFGQDVFFMSDGSDHLQIRNPGNFKLKKKIRVQISEETFNKLKIFNKSKNSKNFINSIKTKNNNDKFKSILYLNELEYVSGKVYANIWYQDYLIIIDAQDGKVIGIVDCRHLANAERQTMQDKHIWQTDNVLNGIAFDSDSKVFFLTGKNWSYIYRVTLISTTILR